MTPRPRRTSFVCASFACLVLLTGCGKSEPPAASASPAAASKLTAPTAKSQAPIVARTPPTTASSGKSAPLAPASTARVPAAAAPVAVLSVVSVTLGSAVNDDHKVDKPAGSFSSTDKTIYASVATEGSTRGATLNAKWTYLEGAGQLVSSISQSIATDGPATTTFKVQNPDLWPSGKYQVEISLDGKSVAKQDFEISKI